jgi:hypothetical protein
MNNFKKSLAAALGVSVVLAGQATFASLITIVNPSFESPSEPNTYSSGGAGNLTAITGWTISGPGSAGVWNLVGTYAGYIATPPDGSQVGYINGLATVSQTLGVDLTPNTTYDLSIWVGGRTDNPFLNPGSAYSISLLGGANILSSVNPIVPPTGGWTELSTTYTTGPSVTPATPLGIAITSIGSQLDFDDVKVTAVPEPTTIISGAMLLLPFGSRALRQLRKKSNSA